MKDEEKMAKSHTFGHVLIHVSSRRQKLVPIEHRDWKDTW